MKYVGLQSQIDTNNRKSILLLLSFPCMMLGMLWLFFALITGFSHSSVYDEYSYKNDKTDEVIKQNSELKDIMILYLAAGKNDDELKSYYSDKEIDTDIKTIQENFDNSTAIVKTYYSTLLNYREIQKDYLKILTAYGCLKPSGIDAVCVEYMPKDNNYGKVKAQYNVSLARVKEQGSNIANAVINAARLLSGIGL